MSWPPRLPCLDSAATAPHVASWLIASRAGVLLMMMMLALIAFGAPIRDAGCKVAEQALGASARRRPHASPSRASSRFVISGPVVPGISWLKADVSGLRLIPSGWLLPPNARPASQSRVSRRGRALRRLARLFILCRHRASPRRPGPDRGRNFRKRFQEGVSMIRFMLDMSLTRCRRRPILLRVAPSRAAGQLMLVSTTAASAKVSRAGELK